MTSAVILTGPGKLAAAMHDAMPGGGKFDPAGMLGDPFQQR